MLPWLGCSQQRYLWGFPLERAGLYSIWKGWGGCPGTRTGEDCAGETEHSERCWDCTEEPGPGERLRGCMLFYYKGHSGGILDSGVWTHSVTIYIYGTFELNKLHKGYTDTW